MPRVVVLCECNPKKLEWGLRYTSTLRERQRETITCKWSLRMLGLRSVAITDNLQLFCLLLSFLSPLDTKKKMASFLSRLFLWHLHLVLFFSAYRKVPSLDFSTCREEPALFFLAQVPLAMLSDITLIPF